MEKCIKIAIDSGYEVKNAWGNSWYDMPVERILLDPLFWQALGKGLGWVNCGRCGKVFNIHSPSYLCPTGEEGITTADVKTFVSQSWKHHWHHFIDHLVEGKDVESFFTNLTK